MVKCVQHYLKSHIQHRDQLLAKKIYRLTKKYTHTLIFIDRGIDHMPGLISYLEHQDFQETSITYYYPYAYDKNNFSLLHFDQDTSYLIEIGMEGAERNKLMNTFK